MLPLLLAALLTPGVDGPFALFIGPLSDEAGFVDSDKGVTDSVKDLTDALRKVPYFRIVSREAEADIKLYVVRREKGRGAPIVTSSVVGNTAITTATPTGVFFLETRLRIGTYEKPFTIEDREATSWHVVNWKNCAKRIAKDVSAWVDTNHERLAAMPR